MTRALADNGQRWFVSDLSRPDACRTVLAGTHFANRLVAVFDTAEEAAAAVQDHNECLKAKGPAEVATSPSRGSNPLTESLNTMSNTTLSLAEATILALPSRRRQRAACPAGPSVMDVIAAHQVAYRMLTEADALLSDAHRAFAASFDERPLELPASGRTFAKLRQHGAEAEIARRSTKSEFGFLPYEGRPSEAEADRMRRVEAGIRDREAEFDLEALAADLDLAARVEDIARSSFLKFPVQTMSDARAKVAHARTMWADGDMEADDLAVFLASFVMRS